jgi:hypothetical protein
VSTDPQLESLIVEGLDLTQREEALRRDEPTRPLSLFEIRQWADEAEAWAARAGKVLPERRDALNFEFNWERPSRVYIQRLLQRLQMYATSDVRLPRRVRTILFLAADPSDASRLRLGEELREIDERLRAAKLRDSLELRSRQAVRAKDLSQALIDERPFIVHFSGHGNPAGTLTVESETGKAVALAPEALTTLFGVFEGEIDCVVLNACYSAAQAHVLLQHVPFIVAMTDAIGDRAAIVFGSGFYKAVGGGLSIEQAFKIGVSELQLLGIPEHHKPQLLKKVT